MGLLNCLPRATLGQATVAIDVRVVGKEETKDYTKCI